MNFINLIYIITLYNIVFANITLNTPQFIKPAAILDDAVPNQTIFIGFTDSKNGYKTAQMFLIKEGELTKKEFSFNLQKDDVIVLNRAHLIKHAKDMVLEMSKDYTSPEIEKFKLPGASGRLAIDVSVKAMVKSKKISEHDALIAKKLGHVLTGGDKGGPFSPVDEQYLLDIEREAFVSLCGEQKSIERIKYMLSKGKPLRN